ncbi:Molybdopterin oxidoreductase [Streptomyces sp. KS_5]|nr:Molybdopterin oxidoreductase [Streptomyces sp. KS_5]
MPSFADMHVPETTASARRSARESPSVGRGRASAERIAAEAAERLLTAGRLLQRASATPEGHPVFRTDQQVSRPPPRRARTVPATNPAGACAARRSPGTSTRRPGSATRMHEVCWWKCSVRRKAVREGPRGGVGGDHRRPGQKALLSVGTRQGRPGPDRLGRGTGDRRAAHVHTLPEYGPDRIAGFSPIPAMSMASHAVGARFHALIGAPMLRSTPGTRIVGCVTARAPSDREAAGAVRRPPVASVAPWKRLRRRCCCSPSPNRGGCSGWPGCPRR